MTNPMEFASVEKLYRVGINKVIFVIDLNSHKHLRDPAVVHDSMMDYQRKFVRVLSWSAQITDEYLYVTVVGDINDLG